VFGQDDVVVAVDQLVLGPVETLDDLRMCFSDVADFPELLPGVRVERLEDVPQQDDFLVVELQIPKKT